MRFSKIAFFVLIALFQAGHANGLAVDDAHTAIMIGRKACADAWGKQFMTEGAYWHVWHARRDGDHWKVWTGEERDPGYSIRVAVTGPGPNGKTECLQHMDD